MLILCPECGHQVSDKAPVCPSCGVEIAGHVERCARCGKYHLTMDEQCPFCQETGQAEEELPVVKPLETEEYPTQNKEYLTENEGYPVEDEERPLQTGEKKAPPRKSHTALVVSFAIAALICATLLYFYKDATARQEADDYQIALKSHNPILLQSYIDTYQHINPEHTDIIRQQLAQAKAQAAASQQSATSGTDAQGAAAQTTTSPDDSESADWAKARNINTPASYERYLKYHPDGPHRTEAEEAIKKTTVNKELSQEESQKAFNAVRRFFIAINKNSRESLSSAVAPSLTTLNGKSNATKTDVIQYMIDLYQADVKNLNWHLGNLTNINKTATADGRAVYRVDIPAKEIIERESTTAEINHRVVAMVNEDGLVTGITITRQ